MRSAGTPPAARSHPRPAMTTADHTPEAPAADPLPPLPGRDCNGRFTNNNQGGPGNPHARRVAALRSALLKAVTEEDIAAVAQRLLEQAKQGDVASARLLFAYALGKPQAAPDPDALDRHEWDVLKESVVPPAEVHETIKRLPLPFAAQITGITLPCVQRTFGDALVRGLEHGPEATFP